MTSPDDLIRDSLRDLIPGYQGPADPYFRVGAAIRRRRARQRALLAVGSAVAAGLVVVAVPVTISLVRGGRGDGPPDGFGDGPAPVGTGLQVARAAVAGGEWTVRAGPMSTGAQQCLYGNDAVFDAAALCFDNWSPQTPVSWGVVASVRPEANATAVFGIAPANITKVVVPMSDGSSHEVRTVAAPDRPDARYFALVAPRPGLTVGVVAAYADTTFAGFVPFSGMQPCQPTADVPCTRSS